MPTSLRSRLGAAAVAAVLVGLLIGPASIVTASAAESEPTASTPNAFESTTDPVDDRAELDRASEVATEALAFTGPEVDHTALAGSIMTAVGMLLVAAARRFTEPDWY